MYLVVHYLSEPEKTKIQKIIDYLINKFDVFDMSGISPHFTLKYTFEEKQLPIVEAICKFLSEDFKSGYYEIGTIKNFSKETIFLSVNLDTESKRICDELLSKCKENNLFIHEHEKEGIHFHITLAQKTTTDFFKIMLFLKNKNFTVKKKFDNLTILKFTGEEFIIHKQYLLS